MRKLLPRDINSSTATAVRARYERSIGETVAAAALAKRAWATAALWLVWQPPDRLKRVHPADLKNRTGPAFLAFSARPESFFVGYNVNGLDILELRAVYAAVKDVAFDNDPRGDKAAWRANARRKLAELVDKERKGALLPNEARRPEYRHVGAFDLELPAPPIIDDDARARASTAA